MEKLIEILKELHPDVDFENEEGLIDNGILDSLDIVTLVTEIDAEFDENEQIEITFWAKNENNPTITHLLTRFHRQRYRQLLPRRHF